MTEKKPIKKPAAKNKPTVKKKSRLVPKSDRPVGRPPEYTKWITEDGLRQITAWSREGLYDYMVAKKMGIVATTFCDWQNKFPELTEALIEGRDQADKIIENALFKSATGYEYVEETYINNGGEGDKERIILDKRVVKNQTANTAAQIFWLKNRQPGKWKDKHEVDNNISGGIKVEFDDEMKKWSE